MASLRYAWRNLWRNPRRTVITQLAVGLNTAVLIVSYALMDGLFVHTISNVTNLVVGEAQIHARQYLSRYSFYDSLADPATVLRRVREHGVPAAPRSYGYGLVACGKKSKGAQFWGVDPAAERVTFDLARHLAEGHFLGDEPQAGAVLGKQLARSLQAAVGSEIVVVVQAADGSLGNELYTVLGILKSAAESIDRNAVILHRDDFAELFVSNGRVHEIALNSKGRLPLDELDDLAARAAPQEEVKTWRQLLPALSDLVNLFDASIAIFAVIFVLAAGLGVMNTTLMATFERFREFGIIRALGATPLRIVADVAVEALILGVSATFWGGILGLIVGFYLQETGLDMRMFAGEFTMAGVAFDPIWRAVVSLRAVVVPIMAIWVICVAAAIYPSIIAARLDPVRAIHHV